MTSYADSRSARRQEGPPHRPLPLARSVHGVAFSTGEVFDSSFGRGQTLPVELGAGGVIPGFEQGLEGMKAGGRRQITIPPELAYGPQGSPPAIGPNETLVFVLDLVSIK